jgi:hypothetical protein
MDIRPNYDLLVYIFKYKFNTVKNKKGEFANKLTASKLMV